MPPNRPTSVTSVHEARDALGKRLRDLRQAAHLNGRQLAESLSWAPSKISKLENAKQTPTDDDIRAWTQATGSGPETEALLASLHTLSPDQAARVSGSLADAFARSFVWAIGLLVIAFVPAVVTALHRSPRPAPEGVLA